MKLSKLETPTAAELVQAFSSRGAALAWRGQRFLVAFARLFPHGLFWARDTETGKEHWMPIESVRVAHPLGVALTGPLGDAYLYPFDADVPDPEAAAEFAVFWRGAERGRGRDAVLEKLNTIAEEWAADATERERR